MTNGLSRSQTRAITNPNSGSLAVSHRWHLSTPRQTLITEHPSDYPKTITGLLTINATVNSNTVTKVTAYKYISHSRIRPIPVDRADIISSDFGSDRGLEDSGFPNLRSCPLSIASQIQGATSLGCARRKFVCAATYQAIMLSGWDASCLHEATRCHSHRRAIREQKLSLARSLSSSFSKHQEENELKKSSRLASLDNPACLSCLCILGLRSACALDLSIICALPLTYSAPATDSKGSHWFTNIQVLLGSWHCRHLRSGAAVENWRMAVVCRCSARYRYRVSSLLVH